MDLPFRVVEASMPLFVDAYLLDGNRWLFGSFWGHETALQEFFARVTLPNHEDGLRSFTLEDHQGKRVVIATGDTVALTKLTGKTPPTTILGALCHVWIFHPDLQTPNRSNGEAFVLGLAQETRGQIWLKAWGVVQDLSQLPLLEHWRNEVMELLANNSWIHELTGAGIQGYRISMPAEAFETAISDMIKNQELMLQPINQTPCAQQGHLF